MAEELPGDFANNHKTDCLQHSFESLVKDLHKDLDTFALDVSNCKKELCNVEAPKAIAEENALEQVLLHLSTQNERLQEELEKVHKEKQQIDEKLQENIIFKDWQIEMLKDLVCKREHEITELNLLLKNNETGDGLSKVCTENACERQLQQKLETANNKNVKLEQELERQMEKQRELIAEMQKLNENLTETKHRNSHLHDYVQRLANLLRSQEDHRMELTNKYNTLEKSYDEQRCQLLNMKSHFDVLDQKQKETENARQEQSHFIHELRQNLSVALEKNKNLEQQAKMANKEILLNRRKCHECQTELQKCKRAHLEEVQNMQKILDAHAKKLSAATTECHKLKAHHDKQIEIQRKNEKIIESFHKWKHAQLLADKTIIDKIKHYEQHIKLLLQHNSQLVERYRALKIEYGNMRDEVERCSRATNFNGDHAWGQRLDLLLQTSRRIMQLRTSSLEHTNHNATS